MSNLITKQDLAQVEQRMLPLLDKKTLEREISFAIQMHNNSNQLQKCSRDSFMKAVYNLAITGLSLNPVMKLAYLIPRYVNGGMQAVLEPSYQGLINLVTDSGAVKTLSARIVYDGDDFDVDYGTESKINHKPKFKSREPLAVYSVAVLHNGQTQFEVMTIDEVNEIRDRSESYKAFSDGKIKSCIWSDFYGEMAKKTVIKRLFKYLPKNKELERAATAISISDEDYNASPSQLDYLVTLIERAAYDDDTKQILVAKVYQGITTDEFNRMKKEAEMNQLDPITAGTNYNQTDIQAHLNKLPENN